MQPFLLSVHIHASQNVFDAVPLKELVESNRSALTSQLQYYRS